MRSYSIDQYMFAGCPEMHGGMIAIHRMTDGRVCVTGCYAFEEGKCQFYRNLTTSIMFNPVQPTVIRGETVRDEAKRLNVSISEIRRLRQREGR